MRRAVAGAREVTEEGEEAELVGVGEGFEVVENEEGAGAGEGVDEEARALIGRGLGDLGLLEPTGDGVEHWGPRPETNGRFCLVFERLASLFLSYRSLRICAFVTPRQTTKSRRIFGDWFLSRVPGEAADGEGAFVVRAVRIHGGLLGGEEEDRRHLLARRFCHSEQPFGSRWGLFGANG